MVEDVVSNAAMNYHNFRIVGQTCVERVSSVIAAETQFTLLNMPDETQFSKEPPALGGQIKQDLLQTLERDDLPSQLTTELYVKGNGPEQPPNEFQLYRQINASRRKFSCSCRTSRKPDAVENKTVWPVSLTQRVIDSAQPCEEFSQHLSEPVREKVFTTQVSINGTVAVLKMFQPPLSTARFAEEKASSCQPNFM